jgi:hypothetical protein
MPVEIAGYLSGLAILASYIPYIRDIFLKKTKPERMSWLIWVALSAISLFSQEAKGATFSLIVTGSEAVGELLVFILAIKYGLGGFLKRDLMALGAAAGSLILWYLTNEPAVALFAVTLIDASGAALTVMKTYEQPTTETISGWVLTAIGGFLGCLAVGGFNFILLVFPIYILVASLAVLAAIWFGKRRKQ